MEYNRSLFKSFRNALDGVFFALKLNRNLKIILVIAFLVIIVSLFFGVSHFEMGILMVMIFLVVASEMINTAIEEMVDLITKEHRQEAKIAKDVAAGMVLVAAIGLLIVGVLIFTPYILRLFNY